MRAVLLALLLAAAPVRAFDVTLDGRAEQGRLVRGFAPPGSTVTFGERAVPVTSTGDFLLGIDRDAPAAVELIVTASDGAKETRTITVTPRTWKIDKVDGVPQKLVTPDPETAALIAADNKLLRAARAQLELTPFYQTGLIRPAEGRISGVFGSQRVLNGTPGAFHAGLDIAGPIGTPVRAAADGVVALQRSMVMSGNTVLLNHGFGLQTTYIHMSKINVADGQRVKQGDVIGEIGMTGRANGPHLHFSVNWFNTCLDPETVLAVLPPAPVPLIILPDSQVSLAGQSIPLSKLEDALREMEKRRGPLSVSLESTSRDVGFPAFEAAMKVLLKTGTKFGFLGNEQALNP